MQDHIDEPRDLDHELAERRELELQLADVDAELDGLERDADDLVARRATLRAERDAIARALSAR